MEDKIKQIENVLSNVILPEFSITQEEEYYKNIIKKIKEIVYD